MAREEVTCPLCDVKVNAEVVKSTAMKTVYKCPNKSAANEAHLFGKKTILGKTLGFGLRAGAFFLLGDLSDGDLDTFS